MNIPTATYRLQFHHDFTFRHLSGLVDYLEDLGITAVYASPILAAAKGSEHGYDGINPHRINPEIGELDELKILSKQLRDKGIGWIQDIVPNHLAFHTDNPWIFDVLERGISSSYAHYFDIDWDHPLYTKKLMVPFLEKELALCIAEKKIHLNFSSSGFSLNYGDYSFPVNIETFSLILPECTVENTETASLLEVMKANKKVTSGEWGLMKKDLVAMMGNAFTSRIRERLGQLNNEPDTLLEIIRAQYYVPCFYSLSDTQINYRRFFNINSLICLRMEDEEVFRDCHRFIHELYQEGIITGLRVDHIDGLKNPAEYIRRLRGLFGDDCYIIAEKILDIKEQLPPLNIQGTSGYEFLSYTNQLITDSSGAEKLELIYKRYSDSDRDYYRIVFDNKLSNLRHSLHGEWDNLMRALLKLKVLAGKSFDEEQLKMALGAFMAGFPVYRAYPEAWPMNAGDQALFREGFTTALKYHPSLQHELSILQQLLIPENPASLTDAAAMLSFIQRLMQFTGPMTAKGVEDTTFYQYNVLISHNEVGDAPCVLGIPIDEFHKKMQRRAQDNPLSMNSTSTHDTKRGEDARVRINLLSELTDEWDDLVSRCRLLAEPLRQRVGNVLAPSVNDEYFLYQAIIGSLNSNPVGDEDFITRTKNYFIKVLRESKVNSNHTNPNNAYEQACMRFIDRVLDPAQPFLSLLTSFVQRLMPFAHIYSLVQVIIKLTAPGIPDIYRGCELWDHNYVDPDNRRPVNYELAKKLMHELKSQQQQGHTAILEWATLHRESGADKLWITRALLHIRKKRPRLFTEGSYVPIYAQERGRDLIAYLRHYQQDWVLVLLPLGVVSASNKLLQITLPAEAPSVWKNLFTGKVIQGSFHLNELFSEYPVAVLEVC